MKLKTSLIGGAALGCVLALGLGASANAQEMTYKWSGAPRFTNDDATFKVRGRILIDAVVQDVDFDNAGTAADYETRNMRGRQVFLGVEGQINQSFAYKAEGGAVNGGAWAWDDVVIEWKATETTSVMVGNIKAAGLENLTSTRFTTFMDRGPFGDIGPDSYVVSAVVKTNGPNWTLTGAIQGASLNTGDVTAAGDAKERIGFTARASWAPVLTDFDKVHLGLWGRKRDRGSEGAFSYNPRANTAYANSAALNSGNPVVTGAVADTDTTWGVEGAWVHKNFSLQAEYADIKADRLVGANGGDPNIKVGYVFASFWPTGEMRNYDPTKGEFGRPKILNPVNAGGLGGVELALRYDMADLTDVYDTAIPAAKNTYRDAGKYTAWTFGVNYYPISYVRFQANYTKGKADQPVSTRDLDIDTFQLRAQLDF